MDVLGRGNYAHLPLGYDPAALASENVRSICFLQGRPCNRWGSEGRPELAKNLRSGGADASAELAPGPKRGPSAPRLSI